MSRAADFDAKLSIAHQRQSSTAMQAVAKLSELLLLDIPVQVVRYEC